MRFTIKGIHVGAAIAALAWIAWWTFPAWMPSVAAAIWSNPTTKLELQVERPDWQGLTVTSLSWRNHANHVQLDGVQLRWYPFLGLEADAAQVVIQQTATDATPASPLALGKLTKPWPAVRIRHLVIDTPYLHFAGSWHNDRQRANLTGTIGKDDTFFPIDAEVFRRDGDSLLRASVQIGGSSHLTGSWSPEPGHQATLAGSLGAEVMQLLPQELNAFHGADFRWVADTGNNPLLPTSWSRIHGDWLVSLQPASESPGGNNGGVLSGSLDWTPPTLRAVVEAKERRWLPLPWGARSDWRVSVTAPLHLWARHSQGRWRARMEGALSWKDGVGQSAQLHQAHVTCDKSLRCQAGADMVASLALKELPSPIPLSGNLELRSRVSAQLDSNTWTISLKNTKVASQAVRMAGSELALSELSARLEPVDISGKRTDGLVTMSPIKGHLAGAWSWQSLSGTWHASFAQDGKSGKATGTLAMGSENLTWVVSLSPEKRITVKADGRDLTLPRWLGQLGGKRWRLYSGQADVTWRASFPMEKLDDMDTLATAWHYVSKYTTKGSYVRLRELGGHFEKMLWQDLRLDATMGADGHWQLQGNLEKINTAADIAVSQAKWSATVDDAGVLRLRGLKGHFLGGTLHLHPLTLPLFEPFGSWRTNGTISVRQLSLSELSQALSMDGLSAEGTVDLALPFTLSAGKLSVQQGSIQATQPGILRYQKGLKASNVAFAALENFHYRELHGQLDYAESGDYHLSMRLVGTNPDLKDYKGVPIAINPDIRGHLPELFWSVFITGEFEQNLYENLRKTSP